MSTNILKKLVEQFAPETVRKEIDKIDAVAAMEREARYQRQSLEKSLLDSLERESRRGNGKGRIFGTESPAETIACIS